MVGPDLTYGGIVRFFTSVYNGLMGIQKCFAEDAGTKRRISYGKQETGGDLPCAPAGRVVLAPLTMADDLWFFYKAKKGEFRHGRRSGQSSLWFYRIQLSSKE